MHDQLEPQFSDAIIPEFDHLLKLPRGVHVQQRKRRLGRIKSLHSQVQHDRRIFADGVQHDRIFALRHHLPHDVDTLGFQPLEMCEGFTQRLFQCPIWGRQLDPSCLTSTIRMLLLAYAY